MSLRCYFQNVYDFEKKQYEKFVSNIQFDLLTKRFIRCGTCFNCKKVNALEWTTKAKFEMSQWKFAYFLTLTYNNENVPLELNTRDYQLFLKRFRIYLKRKHNGETCRYLVSGEYGSRYSRPHYHMIIYTNVDLTKTFYRVAKKQNSSRLIEDMWGLGYITIAPATIETIAYTAFYSTKKLTKSERFSFVKNSENGLLPKQEFIHASFRFGQALVRENIDYYRENWRSLPKTLIKESIFGKDFVDMVKEEKQELMLKLHCSIDWKKQREEYLAIERKQKENLITKRNLNYK